MQKLGFGKLLFLRGFLPWKVHLPGYVFFFFWLFSQAANLDPLLGIFFHALVLLTIIAGSLHTFRYPSRTRILKGRGYDFLSYTQVCDLMLFYKYSVKRAGQRKLMETLSVEEPLVHGRFKGGGDIPTFIQCINKLPHYDEARLCPVWDAQLPFESLYYLMRLYSGLPTAWNPALFKEEP